MKPYYSDDHVTLYHGDCREVTEWLAADVLVTDPPYGIGWRRGANPARLSERHEGIANDTDTSCRDAAVALWGTRPAIVFGSVYLAPPPTTRHVGVYVKPDDAGVVGSTLGLRRDLEAIYWLGAWPPAPPARGSAFRSRVNGNRGIPHTGDHPHVKPEDVIRALLELCPPGVIADPFAGSGTTLRAAKDLGRKAIGVEIEERYCEITARRCAQEVLFS